MLKHDQADLSQCYCIHSQNFLKLSLVAVWKNITYCRKCHSNNAMNLMCIILTFKVSKMI